MGNQTPQTKEDLFNLRHSFLHNVVEHTFRVVKKRFGILSNMTNYSFKFQIRLVLSCFMIHNFIRMHQGYEDAFDIQAAAEAAEADREDEPDEPDEPAEVHPINAAEMRALNNWRNNIASAMWADYKNEREARDMPRLHLLKLLFSRKSCK